MHVTVFYFCVRVTISLNCDVISLSETGPETQPCPWEIHSWKCIWIFLFENAVILSRGDELSLFHGPHTFARDWLAQDSAVCCAWTSVEQSTRLDTKYTPLTLITPDKHRPSYAIAMVADALVSNWRQAISNHQGDVIIFILRVQGIILHPLNKSCARVVGHLSVSLLLTGSPSDNDNVLCDVHNLSMKTR